ncbi:DUF4352 domain-containing protein [Salinactinospora qingdaonensis]|uniref:DUF4352 domain-containing protein n=1 Tax=Salinactinospora qingdaonensis TaxID=702744 RepID=A0ABP7FFK6_9ACTN
MAHARQPAQPQQPQKKNWWLWGCLGCGGLAVVILIVAVAFIAVLSGGDSGDSGPADGGGRSEEAGNTVTMGEAGTVGDWTVTVTGIETTATYGDEFSEETAQGEFKVVSLTVRNTGDEATSFDFSAVKLLDADGKEYSSQTTLGESELFLEQINPGNEVSGEVPVDVPEGTEITSVLIEDVWSLSEPLTVTVE